MEITITEPQRLELRRALSERKETLEKLRKKNDDMGLIQGARDADTHIRIIAGGPGAEKGLLDILATAEEMEQQGMFDDAPPAGHEDVAPEDERLPLAPEIRAKIVDFVAGTLPDDFEQKVTDLLEDSQASSEAMDEGEAILLVVGDEWRHAIEHNEGKGNLFEYVEEEEDGEYELVSNVKLRASPFPALWWDEAVDIEEADPTVSEQALLDVVYEATTIPPNELLVLLSLVVDEDAVPPAEAVEQWPWQDRRRAWEWAVYLAVSDHTDIEPPPRPDDLLDRPYGLEGDENEGKVTSIEEARKKAQDISRTGTHGGQPLTKFEQITPTLLSILQREGIKTVEDLRERRGDAVKLKGVGPKSVAAIDEVLDAAPAEEESEEGGS